MGLYFDSAEKGGKHETNALPLPLELKILAFIEHSLFAVRNQTWSRASRADILSGIACRDVTFSA
jgi:hypothetical protein